MRSAEFFRRCPAHMGLLLAIFILGAGSAWAADDEDDNASKATTKVPNVYLDLSTAYAAVPANTLLLGFRNIASLSRSSSRNLTVNAPLTVDVTDKLTLVAGVTGSTSSTAGTGWQEMTLDSWNVGFTAEIFEQKDWFPKVTVQSVLSRTIQTGTLGIAATSSSSAVELNYALDEDETRGVIGGIKYTDISVDSRLVKIGPSLIGYAGGYYQWPNNWKVTGRFGVQSFDGANFILPVRLPSFTQPIVKLDLERMDDNDNRLFGASFEIIWAPKPIFQLTLNTPIYAVRN
ncbi:MAG TPA: hypothetical protein VGC26_10830 [Afipia sp.]